MASRQTRVIGGNLTRTQSFELAPGILQYVQSVLVEVDASASPDTTPLLTIKTQDGVPIADKQQGQALNGGGSGRATWALRLDDERPATPPEPPGVGGMIRRDGAAVALNVPSGFLNTSTVLLKHNVIDWSAGVTCDVASTPSKITILTDGMYEIMASIAWVPIGAGEYGMFNEWGAAGGFTTADAVTARRIVNQPNFLEASRIVRCDAGTVVTQGVAQSSGAGINAPIGFLQVMRTGALP